MMRILDYCFAILFLFGVWHLGNAKDLGKLECHPKDGMKPNSALINTIISKCQPKQGQDDRTTTACLVKCLMKQQKALDKKGKMKVKKAIEICSVFPEEFQDKVKTKFEECSKQHNGKLKKEPNGCESWFPFTDCFFQYGKSLCLSDKEREKMEAEAASSGNNGETTIAPSDNLDNSTIAAE